MESSSNENATRTRRLLMARTGLLERSGFYGMLLMQMGFALSDDYSTAWTDGETISFNPGFLDGLGDGELEFVLQHEVLHAALRHPVRGLALEDRMRFNIAADIVVNSNILESNGGDLGSITLRGFGEPSMHLAPNGREGCLYSLGEVYEMLGGISSGPSPLAGSGPATPDASGGSDDGTGRGDSDGGNGAGGSSREEGGGPDSSSDSDSVLSPGSSHEAGLDSGKGKGGGSQSPGGWDWHVGPAGDGGWADEAEWWSRIERAAAAAESREGAALRGAVPAGIRRMLKELHEPVLDWREILAEFVQEEVCDYSFSPPDRRFPDSPFLLPDYNDTEAALRDVLLLVDASGSVSDQMLSDVLSEIAGAIDQFDGKLTGWVSFFDFEASEPQRFDGREELLSIEPVGGGGTSFHAALGALDLVDGTGGGDVSSIVILTDGYAPFPRESEARGIPVLWLITTPEVDPPWGRVARLDSSSSRH